MKIIIIGAGGVGAGIAAALKAEGHEIIIASRSEEPRIDVTDIHSVREFFLDIEIDLEAAIAEKEKLVDAVIYTAGCAIGNERVEDKPVAEFSRVLQTNATGLLNVLHYAIPLLRKSKGFFLQIGSIASYFQYEGGVDYCAAKAAANSVMKGIRYELLGAGIRTCSLEIGLTETDFQMKRYHGNEAKARRHYEGVEMLKPADIGRLVSFILSSPPHVNFDEIIIKPIDQATHGKTFKRAGINGYQPENKTE